ncbi:hypothetical protein AAFN60_01985 [Roseibacillus persicicus]|uniref:hypothetical protein n=1 Tax=Roseibacillus persicicus TaxID=454148 RepID=UPI00398AC68B
MANLYNDTLTAGNTEPITVSEDSAVGIYADNDFTAYFVVDSIDKPVESFRGRTSIRLQCLGTTLKIKAGASDVVLKVSQL